MSALVIQGLACICGVWSCAVLLVQGVGISQLFRHYSAPRRRAAVEALEDPAAVPHITVIRPVKGLEPALYECLASSFRQSYPRARLSIRLCVESRDDPAWPVLERLVAAFPGTDARILVEAEDPLLHDDGASGGHEHNLGPNPKIRNISRAYREAPADSLVWIVDCNVWVAPGVAGRMVDTLCGFRTAPAPDAAGRLRVAASAAPYKFVHQLPLVVDVSSSSSSPSAGAALDEMFMATSHAKFYCAINTVGIAPCIVGKSNMFRKAHLDALTGDSPRGRGIDYFSSYICEDHLIGDLLWRAPIPGHRNHGLVLGDLAIQPMAGVSVAAYAARRVRWLRVRKWTVLLATLVEPGVESLLCAAYASFALTTLAPRLPLPPWLAAWLVPATWTALLRCWLALVGLWMAADWCTYRRLQACRCVSSSSDDDGATPPFARRDRPMKPLAAWLRAWLGRELLALPIWTYAVLLGATVAWRGKQFRVRMDMSVVELDAQGRPVSGRPADGRPARADVDGQSGKARVE